MVEVKATELRHFRGSFPLPSMPRHRHHASPLSTKFLVFRQQVQGDTIAGPLWA